MTIPQLRDLPLLPPPLRGGRTVLSAEREDGSGGGQRLRAFAGVAPHPILLGLRPRTIDRPTVGAVAARFLATFLMMLLAIAARGAERPSVSVVNGNIFFSTMGKQVQLT